MAKKVNKGFLSAFSSAFGFPKDLSTVSQAPPGIDVGRDIVPRRAGPQTESMAARAKLGDLVSGLPDQVDFGAPVNVADQFKGSAPVAIQGPQPDFFANLLQQKNEPILQKFAAPGGVSDQVLQNLESRGLLSGGATGAAGQFFQQTAAEPFANALQGAQRDVAVIAGEIDQRVRELNAQRQDQFRQFMGDLMLADAERGLRREEAQIRLNTQLAELKSDIFDAVQTGATRDELAEIENRVRLFDAATDFQAAERRNRILEVQSFLDASQIPGAFQSFPFEEFGLIPPPPEEEG